MDQQYQDIKDLYKFLGLENVDSVNMTFATGNLAGNFACDFSNIQSGIGTNIEQVNDNNQIN